MSPEEQQYREALARIEPGCTKCLCYVPLSLPAMGAVLDVRKGGERGECRRNPPQIVSMMGPQGAAMGAGFPQVQPGHWCGQFVPSKTAVTEALGGGTGNKTQ